MRLSTSNDSKPDNYQINAKICRLVEHYPCMYDRSHTHYLKKDVVDKAWVKISKEMDDSIPSCKERWRNIRTSFARSINVNKIPSSANRTKPYYLHEELQFLARHITPGIPVSRRPNYYTSADEKSEMIEVPIGGESFDGFAAMAQDDEEDEERIAEDDVKDDHPASSSADEDNESAKDEPTANCQPPAVPVQAQALEQKLPLQQSPLPLALPLPPKQQQVIPQQQPAIETMAEERIAEVPVMPLYPFKKRLRTAESMMCMEMEQERDVKPQPSELSTPDTNFDAAFLQGLLPEMKAMDFRQKIVFKKRIYEVIGEIFEGISNTGTAAAVTANVNNTPLINDFAAYANGFTSSKVHTPVPTRTPATSPNAASYVTPLNAANTASATTMTVVNAADLAMMRRLNTLLQSPAVVSSTSAVTPLPKNVASISSTVRTINTPTTAAAAAAHRGAMTRSSANMLRATSSTYASPSSSPAISQAVKQEMLDE